ncbi:MAG: virulence RhuM family protein [Sulfurovum sp.]|nr:virulence RhuM family protein [Sulfurovum sp.]MCB4773589.1 virulence RhuM family protein [Sulfurovum sp.]MCB4780973.1 virulence RhuM family protein [Sulfurovum sp.]MCB4784413.1 virulence RhuM family protein [Sulfurovum sp.]
MSEILLYKTPNEEIKLEVLIENETIWLTQKQIAELFGVKVPAISKHIKNIFESGELVEEVVVSKMEITTQHGAIAEKQQSKDVNFYNLDMIISIGYRVNSKQATKFRIWATSVLREYIIKGFAMDDERLKNPNQPFGEDYFDEQLERIRDIRSSERRFYQKITDIYAQCSIDYDPNSQMTKDFYATVQNKFHFAITGLTAAEIVEQRADSSKENMGLTSWKNSPKGKIRQSDVTIAKNYLSHDELDTYNRIVEMYLNFAELQAKNKTPMSQKEWIEKLNAFLTLNGKEILTHKGNTSAKIAQSLALKEYEKFKKIEDKNYISDFDKMVMKLEKKT